jgi:hypothetical protein
MEGGSDVFMTQPPLFVLRMSTFKLGTSVLLSFVLDVLAHANTPFA